jgi:hypothetical protein
MPNLSIKDVPEAWAEALRRRAARNHRSLQGELLSMVEQFINDRSATFPSIDAQFPQGSAKSNKSAIAGSLSIDDLYAFSVARSPKPDTRGMQSVDMIRQERDSR